MKYIRTSTGILDNTKGDWEVTDRFNRDGDKLTIVARKQDIHEAYITSPNFPLGQADTIEELCDEFVYINKKDDIKCFCLLHHPITTIYYGASLKDVETKDLIKDKNVEIYGAIWTDKGLIYVAKMDDKGELELL